MRIERDSFEVVAIRLPLGTASSLSRIALKRQVPRARLLRRALVAFAAAHDPPEPYLEEVQLVPQRRAVDKVQNSLTAMRTATTLDYMERGYSVMQIASMTKRPYKDILTELGREAERLAERMKDA